MGVEDFDAARRERQASLKPYQFRLGGQTFTCLRTIPFERLLQVVEADVARPIDERFRASCDFVAECLADDAQRDRWRAVLLNPADPIIEDDVTPIVHRLVEVFATRPTVPPSAASAGRSATGGTSSSTRGRRSQAKKAS